MLNLIRKELYQMRWIIIIGLLFSLGVAIITVATFHYLEQIVTEIPAEMLELLSKYEVTRELLFIFGDYSLYVWSQWNAKNLLQAGALFVIIIAASQYAGETSKNTMSFYLTRPVTRLQGYLAKTAAAFTVLLIIFGVGTAIILISSAIVGLTAEWGKLYVTLLIGLIWLLVYYLLGSIISTLNREPITAGVLIGVCGIVLSLPGLFAQIRFLSIFHHIRAVEYYLYGESPFMTILLGLVCCAALLGIGFRVFSKTDF